MNVCQLRLVLISPFFPAIPSLFICLSLFPLLPPYNCFHNHAMVALLGDSYPIRFDYKYNNKIDITNKKKPRTFF